MSKKAARHETQKPFQMLKKHFTLANSLVSYASCSHSVLTFTLSRSLWQKYGEILLIEREPKIAEHTRTHKQHGKVTQ